MPSVGTHTSGKERIQGIIQKANNNDTETLFYQQKCKLFHIKKFVIGLFGYLT
jgi:hypothetical protein